ncbi:MAG: HAMP domain-containing histidine kinase [Gammaproteobacteria bacterium]|nr:HAMP domain-containing histidine kinase [Gammaproteobacteria bacterium]
MTGDREFEPKKPEGLYASPPENPPDAVAVDKDAGARDSAPLEGLGVLERRWYTFFARFVHDLKNPLTPILTAAQLLRRYGVEKPDVVEWAAITIERQTQQLSVKLNVALDLARAAMGQLQIAGTPLDLQPLLARALDTIRAPAEEAGLALSVRMPSNALGVFGDAGRLEQVVMLLLLRAVETTPKGGRIDLAASIEGQEVVVRVSDQGLGFDAAVLKTLFDPFGTADEPGLQKEVPVGLALARALVMLHGGGLSASSAGVGRGAMFVMRLPVFDPAP